MGIAVGKAAQNDGYLYQDNGKGKERCHIS